MSTICSTCDCNKHNYYYKAGAPSPSSQIKAWSGLAAAAVIAATNSDFLIRMATDLKRDTTKGPLEVRIYDNNNSVFYDLIELQDETEEVIKVHMIAASVRAGAPIGDGDEFKDIAKDKKKIVKTYQELQVYFAGFNQQMYSATIEAEPTAFQEANVNYDIELKNPYLGIILWLLITKGASTNKTGKRIDDMRRRLGQAAEAPVQRALDVAGYLGNIQNMYLQFLAEGGNVEATHDVLLPATLETLSEGVHYVTHLDAKQWRKIGKSAQVFKDKRHAGKNVTWKEVHAALLLEYNSVFDNTSVSAMGDARVQHTKRAQFPMGVAFAAVAGESDQSTLADLALAAYDKPATAADYQALMENHTPLPGLIERNKPSVPSSTPDTEGAKKGGGKLGGGKPASTNCDKNGPGRQFMPTWRCGHMVDGRLCNHFNYHYASSKQSDTEVQKTFKKCDGDKKVADKKHLSEKSGGHNAEFVKDIKEIKQTMMMLAQAAKDTGSSTASKGNGFSILKESGAAFEEDCANAFAVMDQHRPDIQPKESPRGPDQERNAWWISAAVTSLLATVQINRRDLLSASIAVIAMVLCMWFWPTPGFKGAEGASVRRGATDT